MSFVTSIHNIDKIKSDFDEVCDFLQELLDTIGKKTSVKATKLYKYKKQLDNITNENIEDYAKTLKTLHVIQRYNHIVLTIKNNRNHFKFKEKSLLKIIDGTSEIDDLKDKSNHTLFELEMAVRFFYLSKNSGNSVKINLSDTGCDVIFDDFFAIECKYIESEKNMLNNIKRAISQAKNRVTNGEAKYGLIALDFSNIIDIKKIDEFSQCMFSDFYNKMKYISKNPYVSEITNVNIELLVVENDHLKKIIKNFIASELEYYFYKNTSKDILNDLGSDMKVIALIYQSKNIFLFQSENTLTPISNRDLGYFICDTLPKEAYDLLEKFIHGLATGT